MRHHLRVALAIALCSVLLLPAPVQAKIRCERTTISRLTYPSGPSEAQAGFMNLRDGRNARISNDDVANMQTFARRRMRVGDSVVACIGDPSYSYRGGPMRPQIAIMDESANFLFTSLFI